MDKLTALRTAIDEILDDDRVTYEDGIYTVRNDSGSTLLVTPWETTEEWVIRFENSRVMPYAPRGERPHELVAWALQ